MQAADAASRYGFRRGTCFGRYVDTYGTYRVNTARRKAYKWCREVGDMETLLFIGGLGPMELGLVALVLILLFGASKLPDLARSMGSATGEFKKGRQEVEEELEEMQEGPEAEADEVEEAEPAGDTERSNA
jgi:sec-independent protein translocase protein TatA